MALRHVGISAKSGLSRKRRLSSQNCDKAAPFAENENVIATGEPVLVRPWA